jgi:hypothetical protein
VDETAEPTDSPVDGEAVPDEEVSPEEGDSGV